MKIAILYICTGKYNIFWKDFYNSCKNFFLPDIEKHFFVFSDDAQISGQDVSLIKRECLGFPLDSLYRFKMFYEINDQLRDFDYIYFFNSNMLFISAVGLEFLPNGMNDNGLIGVLHPGHVNQKPVYFPYERNRRSQAYIKNNHKYSDYYYYMGGVNGGQSDSYIRLIEICMNRIDIDYSQNIIAKYHDESHLNKYFFENPPKILPPSYGYPEGSHLNYKPIIVIRDKVKIDITFQKQSKNILIRLINKLRTYYNALFWK